MDVQELFETLRTEGDLEIIGAEASIIENTWQRRVLLAMIPFVSTGINQGTLSGISVENESVRVQMQITTNVAQAFAASESYLAGRHYQCAATACGTHSRGAPAGESLSNDQPMFFGLLGHYSVCDAGQ